jgi:transcription elongation factor
MAKPDGRIEKGQRISSAISARAWNRAQDAADIVLGVTPGIAAGDARQSAHYLGKTTAAWTKGTSQTITLWAGTPGSESALSDQVIAWNKFADVAIGKFVMLARANDTYYLIAAEC